LISKSSFLKSNLLGESFDRVHLNGSFTESDGSQFQPIELIAAGEEDCQQITTYFESFHHTDLLYDLKYCTRVMWVTFLTILCDFGSTFKFQQHSHSRF